MRKIYVLLFIVFSIVLLTSTAWSQNLISKQYYEKGKEFYDKSNYEDAIPPLKKALTLEKDYQDALYYLGLSYKYASKNDDALEQFAKLETVNPDYWGWFYFEAGNAYLEKGQFDESISWFEKFRKKFVNDASHTIYHHQAQFKIQYATGKKELLNESKAGMKVPALLPSNVNSTYPDYMPSSDPTGRTLYFTSKRKGGIKPDADSEKEGDEDIYKIELKDGKWSDPDLLPEPINSSNHDGASTFSADGQTVVFTACGRDGGIGSCDLFILTLEGSKWSEPKNLGNVVNSDEWDSQPTISSDGSRIIFSSTRKGGYGSEDLYMIEKNMFGEWGPPQNLGGNVNTPYSDISPYLSPDQKTLYFASYGHPGYGGYDVFKTVTENGKWSVPINMGSPLNTSGDDRYFTIAGSGEVGYFASDRENNDSNLFSIDIPEDMRPTPTVIVSGVVSNIKNGEKVGAYVLVEDINSGELIAVNKSNSVTGKYLIVLPAGRNYSVSANKEGFFFYSQSFDVAVDAKYQEIKKDIPLKPIEKGARVVLNNIFFETGKAALSPDSKLELDKAFDLMKKNPSMVIEVGGHTDNVGDDNYNMKLSHDRSRSVRDYIIKAGIDPNRIQAKGYGESSPIAANDSDEGRKANRRTEFIILEF